MLYTVPLKTYMYDYTASIHSFCSPHVLSSSPPWQSSAPSHLLTRGMHWRDERHSNWLPAQIEPGGGAARGKEYWSYESTCSWIQQCSTVFQSEINRCLEDNRGINKNCRNVILPPWVLGEEGGSVFKTCLPYQTKDSLAEIVCAKFKSENLEVLHGIYGVIIILWVKGNY